MCGLSGFLSPHPEAQYVMKGLVERMADRLVHRGPDTGNSWAEDGIALGHRRLAILDLSAEGAQPMQSACGRFVVAFNGEIYNHLDLRIALEQCGAAPNWRGHSDTETLLAGITHWGLDETLIRSVGMFALAVWDRRDKRLLLARDRMGEKPLYWGWAGKVLVFGSELTALREHPGFPREVCKQALAQYLTFGYVPAPRSIHPGIYKLEPGCILELKGELPPSAPADPLRPDQGYGGLIIRRFWSLSETIAAGHRQIITDDSEAIILVESTLRTAVERQMLADVPLGAFLSGGIDSSLIVALMQTASSKPVQTFTIGFENREFDESPHASAIAGHLGTDHTSLMLTDTDVRSVIPLLPEMYDEPFGDPSQIPTHLVCREARKKVTVALSGDAGDELFGGYNRYFWGPRIWNRLAWLPSPARGGLGRLITSVPLNWWDSIGRLGGRRLALAHAGDKAYRLADRLQATRTIDDFYRSLVTVWPGHHMVPGLTAMPDSPLDDPLPEVGVEEAAQRMMAQDMRSYLPGDILCKVDRAAMSVSLETRVPFLDPDVLALSARLSPRMKIREGQGKWGLRQVLYRHVPKQLIERPKTGFSIPLGDWLRGPLRPWADELLSPASLSRDGLIDPASVLCVWEEHLSGRRDWAHRLWIVLMFLAWMDTQR